MTPRPRLRRPLALLAAGATGAALMFGVAACGSDSSSSSTASTAGTSTATAPTTPADTSDTGATTPTTPVDTTEGAPVAVTMGSPKEFSMVPAVSTAKAGQVTFTVTNSGTMVHEFVVVTSDKKAADLPTESDGSASEAGSVGEIPDMAPGSTKTVVLNLTPGHYALICNLPGHYAGGMYADFTVQ